MPMPTKTLVRFFTDTNALESLRSSDFDALSAYGEVVDNAIQANAKNVRIKFKTATRGGTQYQHIESVAFGDDGEGMDEETLHHCSQIGWSSRYNRRDGIGRFGVGMTLAAIHECKRVEIFSKTKGGEWLYTYMDLDENTRGELEGIPTPAPRTLPKDLRMLVGEPSGTLVIWSKYDRQSVSAKKICDDAKVWFGRTYRYFIWDDNVSIFLNGELVKVIDPLYGRTEKTQFPEDPRAKVYQPIVFPWRVDTFDSPKDSPTESSIRIVLSLLPEEWRPHKGSGGSVDMRERYVDMNEGVSILRNRREVFYGHIPYWGSAGGLKGWPSFEEIDRWWGCEIHFEAHLDRAFTVKNIKRGADPSKELKATLKDQLTPTRQTCLEEVRRVWSEYTLKQREKAGEPGEGSDPLGRPGDHLPAEKAAKHTPTDRTALDAERDRIAETEKYLEEKQKGLDAEKKLRMAALFNAQPFTILEKTWKGPQFLDASYLGGSAVLEYNLGHVFFEEVYGIIEGLDNQEDKATAARRLKTLLDLLMIAHAKAEARFSPDAEHSAQEFVDNLRANWGQYLQSYVRTWLKERESE